MAKVQAGALPRALLDQLKLDKLPGGMRVEEDTIHVVYDLGPCAGVHQVLTFSLNDIDGALAVDLDWEANTMAPGGRFGQDRQRYYQTVTVHRDGIPVSPIECRLLIRRVGSVNGAVVGHQHLTAGEYYTFGPFLVTDGFEQVVQTLEFGDMGDTLEVWRQGFTSEPGGRLPMPASVERSG